MLLRLFFFLLLFLFLQVIRSVHDWHEGRSLGLVLMEVGNRPPLTAVLAPVYFWKESILLLAELVEGLRVLFVVLLRAVRSPVELT